MAKCPYFEDKGGGWYEISPYCKIVENSVSDAKYKNYCDEYSYEDCDIYKAR